LGHHQPQYNPELLYDPKNYEGRKIVSVSVGTDHLVALTGTSPLFKKVLLFLTVGKR